MKTIFLSEIKDPIKAIEALGDVYLKLKIVATKENDLHNYIKH